MAPELWSWLGEPLAVDFANTVRRRGMGYQELLRGPADLHRWAELEAGRVPAPPETAADRLGAVRDLRDAVFSLFLATTRGEQPPADAEQRVNAALAAVPLVPQLRAGTVELTAPGGPDPLDELQARVAASAVDVLAHPGLAFCDAPGCGQFFLRHRGDQRWCDPHCGVRARVARHAARG